MTIGLGGRMGARGISPGGRSSLGRTPLLLRPLRLLALTLALTLASCLLLSAQQPPIGTVSEEVEFALFDGEVLDNRKLSDFAGQIVVLYYYTPW